MFQKTCQEVKIIFIGTPDFGAMVLERVLENYLTLNSENGNLKLKYDHSNY